jgi:hypothetical protein
VEQLLSAHDLKRLESYARNLLDYHVCLDLLPPVARAWFLQRVPVALSALQAALLLGMGLQYKTVDALEAELGLPANQLLALFNRAVRKLSDHFRELMAGHIDQALAPVRDVALEMEPRETSLADEMDEAGRQATADLKVCSSYLLDVHGMWHRGVGVGVVDGMASLPGLCTMQRKHEELIAALDLDQYAVAGTEEAWAEALSTTGKGKGAGVSSVSVRSTPGDKGKGKGKGKEARNDSPKHSKKHKRRHKA